MKLICKDNCALSGTRKKGNGLTMLTSALFLFMPKCALCWVAYMSFFSSIGIVVHYQAWFLPVAIVLFFATLIKLLINSIVKKNYLAFGLAVTAGILIVIQRSDPGIDNGKLFALILMGIAVLLDKFIYLYKQWTVAGKYDHHPDKKETTFEVSNISG